MTEPAGMEARRAAQVCEGIVANVGKVLHGKEAEIRLAVLGLLTEGHILIEDLPGVGKTTLAKALARSTGLEERRIQFTADLLPSDLTGTMVLARSSGTFSFRPGPLFANIVLADELNRASPRAQSALLEAMEERQISVDGATHPLPRPFVVIATQNPADVEGTYPLPHSQRDRFFCRLAIGYPDRASEVRMLDHGSPVTVDELGAVTTPAELIAITRALARVHVAPSLADYVVDVAHATRGHPDVEIGTSPRATGALHLAARAWATICGRDYVIPDDIKAVTRPVLAHRIVVSAGARIAGVDATHVLAGVLDQVPVPSSATTRSA